jgi:hypothetical protein
MPRAARVGPADLLAAKKRSRVERAEPEMQALGWAEMAARVQSLVLRVARAPAQWTQPQELKAEVAEVAVEPRKLQEQPAALGAV